MVEKSAKLPKELTFQGNMARNWEFFKQKFDIYLQASKMEGEEDNYLAALLLNTIGDEALKIYNNLVFETEGDRKSYKKILTKLDEYFIPTRNVTYERNVFFLREMKTDETIDEYVNDLRRLSSNCEFGNLTDSLIKDRIVLGIKDRSLKDRLLRETKLDLKRAIEICKAAEQAKKHLEEIDMAKSKEVDVIYGIQGAKKKVNQKQQRVTPTLRDNRTGRTRCFCCGKDHNKDKNSCPARNVKCFNCNKVGHFSKVCKNKKVNNINEISTGRDSYVDDVDLFLGEINSNISSDNVWTETFMLDNFITHNFKLDTGAQCNILPLRIFKQLKTNMKCKILAKFDGNLTSYNGSEIVSLGTCFVNVSNNRLNRNLQFHVVDSNNCAILGLAACVDMGLIQRCVRVDDLELKKDINIILNEYKTCFEGLGCLKDTYHIEIDKTVTPVIHPPRKVPFAIMGSLKERLDSLEKEKIIEKATEPTEWVNSLVIVYKKDKSIRLCIDPTNLNKAIKREHFKIPTLDEILSKIGEANYFSTVDCSSGFWQIQLDKESSKLCTFNTPFGRYKFLRMPYGISSAPEVFTKRIKQIYDSIPGVDTYVDDILIWGKTIDEHNARLEAVLKIAKDNNLRFNKAKCKFGLTEIKYMGHIISNKGIKPDQTKVEAIKNMSVPQNKKEVERLLGMIQYVSRFIENVSELTEPLRHLLKKSVLFQWNIEQEGALKKIREILSNPPVLGHFQMDKPIVISCDASQNACGAVLLQSDAPVAFFSRALTTSQQGYAQIEKEMLSIVLACERFHQYIYGRSDVTIETDHKPLVMIYKKPLAQTPARLQRMLIKLQQYSFNLVYKKGNELFIADTLSRAAGEIKPSENEEEFDAQLCFVRQNLPMTDKKFKEFQEATAADSHLLALIDIIKNGFPEERRMLPDELKCYWAYREDLNIHDNLIFKGDRLLVPVKLRKDMLQKIHYTHLGKEKCKNLARQVLFWPGMNRDIDELTGSCSVCLSVRRNNTKETMISHEIPDNVWEKVGFDLFTLNGVEYLIGIDYYSKFVEINKMNITTAYGVIEEMKNIFARQGIPKTVFTDNGPQFSCAEFRRFARDYNFCHITSSPRHAQSNGLVERTVQTVKNILKKAHPDGSDPYLAMLMYRNTPISNEIPSPAQILYSRRLRDILPVTQKLLKKKLVNDRKVRESYTDEKKKQKAYYDRNSRDLKELEKGDSVKVKMELNKEWKSGKIIDLCERPRSYVIRLDNGRIVERNRKYIIKVTNNHYLPTCDSYMESESSNGIETAQDSYPETIHIEDTGDLVANNLPENGSANSLYLPSTSNTVTRYGRVVRPPKRFY